MKSRLLAGLPAIAGISCAATIAFAPTAAASFYVAPGVWCEGTTCTNDNDEAYLISAQISCNTMNTQTGVWSTGYVTGSEWAEPHTSVNLALSCAPGDLEGSWTITGAAPRSQVPTGSVG
ncbi:hypothetical protein [Nocardia crassostreae]|uniref:hypothetical protein n=1 Tax=Nocardia crassostreae TaxID=53428 RepID=UPI00082FAEAD|nr:hypothetical protein [Nocardia crassostreae]